MFPSVTVGTIFLHLRQSKLLLALLWRCGERRSPFYQRAETVAFLIELYISVSYRGWGWGRWGHSEERSQNTLPEEISVQIRLPDSRKLWHLIFFLQEKIIWISILFPVPLLSLLLFPISRWEQLALVLFTNILKFHYYVLIYLNLK